MPAKDANWERQAALFAAMEMACSGKYPNAAAIRDELSFAKLDLTALERPRRWRNLDRICANTYKKAEASGVVRQAS